MSESKECDYFLEVDDKEKKEQEKILDDYYGNKDVEVFV